MLQMAQAIAYQLSFMDGGVTSGLVGIAARLWSVTEIASAAQASLSALVAPLQNIAGAWSGREQQLNNISRSLRQYQFVGQSVADINRDITRSMPGATEAERAGRFTEVYQNQFNEARQFSRGIVRQMSADAAILPGELNDYMQTFSTSLPQLAKVQGMTLSRATHLTNYLTAGAISAGIDAPQASRDIMQALTGRASIVDRSWTEVFSNYARFRGKKLNSPAELNRLTQEQRVQVLEDIASQLQPMMDATGDAYEATIGTFNSLRHEMYLDMSEPLFEGFKHILREVNGQLSDLYPKIVGVGKYFAALGGDVLHKVANQIGYFGKYIEAYTPVVVQGIAKISNFITGELLPIASRIYTPLATAARFAGSLLWRVGETMLHVATDYVWPAFKFLTDKVFDVGSTILETGNRVYTGVTATLDLLASLMGSEMGGVGASLSVLSELLLIPFTNIKFYIEQLFIPSILFVAENIGIIMGFLGTAMGYVQIGISTVSAYFQELSGSASNLGVTFTMLAQFLREIPNSLGGAGAGIFDLLRQDAEGTAAAQEGVMQQTAAAIPSWMTNIEKAIADVMDGKNSADLNRRGRGDRTNRPHATQDFRYSRFDITNRFAEGFDPDRVASAFVSDLEAMASQRLSSGFAPAFSLP